MVATFFVLVAFDRFLALLGPARRRPLATLVAFAVSATLAVFTHYYSVFFVGACVVVLGAYLAACPQLRRRLAGVPAGMLGAGFAVLLMIPLGMAYLYFTQARVHTGPLNYLQQFYFKPGGGESLGRFLLRTLHSEAALFVPFPGLTGKANEAFARAFPRPAAVYVDQYSLIYFFAQHSDSRWRYVDREDRRPYAQRYELSGPAQLFVVRNQSRWNADPTSPALYTDLANCMADWHLPSIVVYALPQVHPTAPRSEQDAGALRQRIEQLARAGGLEATAVVIDGYDTFVEVRPLPALPRDADRTSH